MPGPMIINVSPGSVTVPPPKEVTVTVEGGVPPYTLTASGTSGVSGQVNGQNPGTGPWSVIIAASQSGSLTVDAVDQNTQHKTADITVTKV